MIFLQLAWPGSDVARAGGTEFEIPGMGECSAASRHKHITQAAQWEKRVLTEDGKQRRERGREGRAAIRQGPRSSTSEKPACLCSPPGSLAASLDSRPLCKPSLLYLEYLPSALGLAELPQPCQHPISSQTHPDLCILGTGPQTLPMATDCVWPCDMSCTAVIYNK